MIDNRSIIIEENDIVEQAKNNIEILMQSSIHQLSKDVGFDLGRQAILATTPMLKLDLAKRVDKIQKGEQSNTKTIQQWERIQKIIERFLLTRKSLAKDYVNHHSEVQNALMVVNTDSQEQSIIKNIRFYFAEHSKRVQIAIKAFEQFLIDDSRLESAKIDSYNKLKADVDNMGLTIESAGKLAQIKL